MGAKVKYSEGKTNGQEVNLPCTTCSGKPSHKVVASFEESGSDSDHDCSIDWNTDYQVVQCQGCKGVSFRQASTDCESLFQTGEDDWEYEIVEKLYPSRLTGRKGLGEDTYYLPPNLKRIYDETLAALASQSPVLAGIGLRALLETVCKEKSATGGATSFARLTALSPRTYLRPPAPRSFTRSEHSETQQRMR